MIVYLRLIKIENDFVTYEYGYDKNNPIGTITVEIANKDNCTFSYYELSPIKEFCTATSRAVLVVFRFIKNYEFPNEYILANFEPDGRVRSLKRKALKYERQSISLFQSAEKDRGKRRKGS